MDIFATALDKHRQLALALGVPAADAEQLTLGQLEAPKQWQVSILSLGPGIESWHGTVEATDHATAQAVALQAAHEEGFPTGRRHEIFATFLPDGRKVCPACNAQHDRPSRFCSPCINDGDAELFEDHAQKRAGLEAVRDRL